MNTEQQTTQNKQYRYTQVNTGLYRVSYINNFLTPFF
jgi:hypothetical protein